MEFHKVPGGQVWHKGGALWHEDSPAEADPQHRAAAGSMSVRVPSSIMLVNRKHRTGMMLGQRLPRC